MNYNNSTSSQGITATGNSPDAQATTVRNLTLKERVELWFIEPLMRLEKDEAFIALMVMLPLLEKLVRYRKSVPDEQDVVFSDNSPVLRELAQILGPTSEKEASTFWQCFRHGVVHRAMIKSEIPYALMPGKYEKPVLVQDGTVLVYVWQLRDRVVAELNRVGAKMWKDSTCPLPNIYQELR
jgi:hypothetical protein